MRPRRRPVPDVRLGDAVRTALAPPVAARLLAVIARRWGGTRFYLPMAAARFTWLGAEPLGAAERFAADVLHETVAAGGPRQDAELLLLSLAGCQVFVAGGRRRRGWENRPPRGGVDSP